jgi:hypothetical protein
VSEADPSPRRGRKGALLGTVLVGAGAFLAYRYLDLIVATFLVIVAVTVLVIAALAGDWERHSTFEERELARARKRAARRERTRSARERDRARWEAHQAEKSREAGP